MFDYPDYSDPVETRSIISRYIEDSSHVDNIPIDESIPKYKKDRINEDYGYDCNNATMIMGSIPFF